MTYKVFGAHGKMLLSNATTLHECTEHVDIYGGWVERAETGHVLYGKRPVAPRTVDLTPTWRAVMPILIEAATNGTDTGKRLAREELMRLADIADGKIR